jgi:transcription elongation factor Elf1
MRSKPGPPMTLANMRQNGVRAVTATCEACGRSADVNVDALPETIAVPKAGQRLRCSRCGAKRVSRDEIPGRDKSQVRKDSQLNWGAAGRASALREIVHLTLQLGHRQAVAPQQR